MDEIRILRQAGLFAAAIIQKEPSVLGLETYAQNLNQGSDLQPSYQV